MTLGMWIYAIVLIIVSIIIGMVLYCVELKVPFKTGVRIKMQHYKEIIKNIKGR